MVFLYRPIYISDSEKISKLYRPIVDIRLLLKDKFRIYSVLIDSGADYCLFHSSIAKDLGIDLETGDLMNFTGTSSQEQKAYFHNVTFFIGNQKITAKVGFSEDIQQLSFGLLGQQGFFDKFKVSFNLKKKEIEVI